MSSTITQELLKLDIVLTPQITEAFEHMVMAWELRRSHPLALHVQTLGVYPIAFTDADRAAFFQIFEIDPVALKAIIQKIPAINPEYKVVSDAFNVLSVWVLHVAMIQIKSAFDRERFMMAVAKYLHYRFFTSLVNYFFPYGTNEKVMMATINGLSKKFDVVVYGTWKAAIEARCADLISTESIHRHFFETADSDKSFLYVISDTQSRIRDKVKKINNEYRDALERGDVVVMRNSVTEIEGEKKLVEMPRTLDLMVYNLMNEIMADRLFIDNQTIHSITSQFNNITDDMLRSALRAMVDIATTQRDASQLDVVKKSDGHLIYIGMRVLISNLIQKSYRYCMLAGVNVTNHAAVFVKLKNTYSSSRSSDEDIVTIKESVNYLVDLISISRRDATKSSLRLAIIFYLLTRSFRFI